MTHEDVEGYPVGQRWDAAVLLGVGVFCLVARIPMAIPLIGVLSVAAVLLQGVVGRRGFGAPLAFFGLCLATSAVGTALAPSTLLNGYFMMAACFALLALATFFSGSVERNLKTLLGAVYGGLWLHFVLSVGELVSGVKILPLRDPSASTVPTVLADPWVVTSLFVNYNDYSVAMVIFADLLAARLAFAIGQARWRTITQTVALLTTMLMIVMIGSRGSLVALVFTLVIELILIVRFRHPDVVNTRRMWLVLGVGGAGLLVAWNSPYFQNHSTEWRGQIIDQILGMLMASPLRLLFGYGSADAFAVVAKVAFPGQLMNPHNLFVELIMAYGVGGLAVFVGALLWVFVRGFVQQQVPMNALGVAAIATGLGLIVYGAVPSSYLDYGYPYLFVITAGAALWLKSRASGGRPSAAAEDGGQAERGDQAERERHPSDDHQPNHR